MTNYLEAGAKLLQDRMEAYGGISVTYRRPGVFSFNIVAVPGRNPVDIVDRNGAVLRGQVQDFIVTIATMMRGMSADPKKPKRGDEIVSTFGELKIVYLVTGEDFATSHYEPADSYGVAWRIHTRSDRLV